MFQGVVNIGETCHLKLRDIGGGVADDAVVMLLQ